MGNLETKIDNLSSKIDTLERLFRDKLGLFDQTQFTNDVSEKLNKTFKTFLESNLQSEIRNLKKEITEISDDMQYTSDYVKTFASNFAELVAVKILKKINEKAMKE